MPRHPAFRRRSVAFLARGVIAIQYAGSSVAAQNAQPSPARMARDSAFADSIFMANRHAINIKDGMLSGDGADFLMTAMAGTQFFFIGESHNTAQTPTFAAALFDTLHRRFGVNHFAIEDGPTIIKMLEAPQIRGNLDSSYALARRYLHGFQFWNDQEIQAMASMARVAATNPDPLWGLDNEWGGLFIVEKLVPLAPNARARQLALDMVHDARSLEAVRSAETGDVGHRFVTEVDSSRLSALRAAFRPASGSVAEQLIGGLEFAHRTYAAHSVGDRSRFYANLNREQYMKANFMTHYAAAQKAGEKLPKVLLKFGNVHGGRGLNPNGNYALGNFISEFATANGMHSFHLVAWLINEPGDYWTLTESPEFLPLARAGSTHQWYVVDLRPVRDFMYSDRLARMSGALRDLASQYDAVLLIGSGTRGTRNHVASR